MYDDGPLLMSDLETKRGMHERCYHRGTTLRRQMLDNNVQWFTVPRGVRLRSCILTSLNMDFGGTVCLMW